MDSVPEELIELENRLARRAAVEPTAGLRERVLRAAESALREQSRPAPRWGWGVAAAVLVAMNLSMIFASRSEFSVRPGLNNNQLGDEVQALRAIESQQEGAFR